MQVNAMISSRVSVRVVISRAVLLCFCFTVIIVRFFIFSSLWCSWWCINFVLVSWRWFLILRVVEFLSC